MRATEAGAALSLRMGWLGVFWRLRSALAVILLIRLVYCGGMLLESAAFRGTYATMLAGRSSADALMTLLHVSALLAAEILLPVCALGLAAALGILISVALRERIYAAVAQIAVLGALLTLVALGTVVSAQLISGELRMSRDVAQLFLLAHGAFGDWGLSLAHFSGLGEAWARAPQMPGIGLALLMLALAQGFAADALLRLAEWLAERGA